MLVYEKIVGGVRKLFGAEGNVPTDNDVELTFKDGEGAAITPVANDIYRDASFAENQRIVRESDGKFVNVFMGDKQIVGDAVEPVEKELESIEVVEEPAKVEYLEGEALELDGLKVVASYSDGSEKDVTASIVTEPADGAILTADVDTVSISYVEGSATVVTNFAITVVAENEEEAEKEPVEE